MAQTNSLRDFQMTVHSEFIKIAEELKPVLHSRELSPEAARLNGESLADFRGQSLGQGDALLLDFGCHVTGYVSFDFASQGSPPDAPALLEIKLGESQAELLQSVDSYRGNLTASWLQEERTHIDDFPSRLGLPRRYAFRYVQIRVLAISPKYRLTVEGSSVRAVSAADFATVLPLQVQDEELKRLDEAGLLTLHECMQEVFEDGPKRDRRMWLGDLYLQAKTNYAAFRQTELVKRCLYLFAGLRQNEGRIGATLFIKPKLQVDDIFLFDYALHFVNTLHEYYEETGDRATLAELYPVALRQIEIAVRRMDDGGLVQDEDSWWCFVDWGEGLNKQASAQGIFIVALRKMLNLAEVLDETSDEGKLKALLEQAANGMARLYDKEQGLFVSGAERQVSWHSQIWAVLAGLLPEDLARKLLERLPELPHAPQTPFMHHFYVEALLKAGLRQEALSHLKHYWGAMLADGSDTYGEVFNPQNPHYSPYDDKAIESRCHAWSCTPSYFIRRYFAD
ncbi:MAG: hypothetical protein IJU00_08160 [Selenomonas sp.]|nr:hypothetical protein [Selenomonas sp.]